MKFLYEYRTPDNVKHNGIVNAADRDAAYVSLKREGIKPSRLVEAPGLFNKLFGKGKRWIAIFVLAALCVALAVALRGLRSASQNAFANSLGDRTRRQVVGDALVIEKGIRSGWANVFQLEGERFLASFAIPGVPAGQRSTTEKEIQKALDSVPSPSSATGADQSIEARQIRAMVEGMKQELREYLAAGGTVVEYGRRLVQRQEEELGYYHRVKNELEAAEKSGMSEAALEALWEQRNAKLRAMGIKLVPMPE